MKTTEVLPPALGGGSRTLRPLRRSEYDQLVELGAFDQEKLELLNGFLIPKKPEGTRHAFMIQTLGEWFVRALGDRAWVRVQLPFAASEIAEPEPDIAIVPSGDYRDAHPSKALLVIEVADRSLRDDRNVKAPIYAASGVPEFWIIDVNAETVTVHRGPDGDTWSHVIRHGRDETLAPQAFPDVLVPLPELFARP